MFYFTPLSGFFSPFPHGTGSLSVTDVYLALESGLPRFRQDFSCPMVLENLTRSVYAFIYGAITLYGRAFQLTFISINIFDFLKDLQILHVKPHDPEYTATVIY